MTKKLLSLLLTVCMVISFALPSFAATDYEIGLSYNTRKGYVDLYQDTAENGEYVKFDVEAKDGYEIDSVDVVYDDDTERYVAEDMEWYEKNGDVFTYRFKMPASDVTVSVYFQEEDAYDEGEYEIELVKGKNGKVELYQESADEDETVYFDVEPNDGYAIESIEVVNDETDKTVRHYGDDVSKGVYTYRFTMPDAPVTIYVYFIDEDELDENDGFEINIDFNELRGDAWTSLDYADPNTLVEIHTEPENGYYVEDVEITSRDSSKDGDVPCMYDDDEDYYYFIMPNDDVSVYVTFTRGTGNSTSKGDYEITIDDYDEKYGEIWLDKDSADKGAFIKINYDLAPGVDIKAIMAYDDDDKAVTVSKSTSTTNKYYYFYMPASDVKLLVTFSGTPTTDDTYYSVNFVYDEDLGEVWTTKTKYNYGDTVRVNVDPDNGVSVDSIVVKRTNGTTVANVKKSASGSYYTFTMPPSAVSIRVTFDEDGSSSSSSSTTSSYYAIECDYNDAYGTVDIDDEAKSGRKVEFTVEDYDDIYKIRAINLSTGLSFKVYEDDLEGDFYFTMPSSDVYIDVLFEDDVEGSDWDVKIDDYDEKCGEVSVSSKWADEDDEVKIYIQPKNGYEVDSVEVYKGKTRVKNVRSINDYCYYFTMPDGDVEVRVTFAKGEGDYEIESSYDIVHGTVELSADNADSGETVDVTVTPKTGYKIKSVTAKKTGTSVSVTLTKDGDGEYSFKMPTSDVTVTAVFELAIVEYKITDISDASFGTVTVAAKSEKNKAITITATPKNGYTVNTVKVTDAAGKAVTVTKKSATTWSFTMPASDVKINVTFVTAVHVCPSKEYKDVITTEWYHDAVDYAISKNLMNGVSTTEKIFNPAGTVTRAMVTTVLWRIAGEPKSTATLPYTDVPAGEWYTEAVRWAAANGLLTNVSNTTKFEPNATITREQFATVIYRFEQHKAGNTLPKPADNISKYSDMVKISIWAVDALNWCGANKIINGNADGTVAPQGSTTRAQLAQILYNYKDFN